MLNIDSAFAAPMREQAPQTKGGAGEELYFSGSNY